MWYERKDSEKKVHAKISARPTMPETPLKEKRQHKEKWMRWEGSKKNTIKILLKLKIHMCLHIVCSIQG